MHKPYHSRLPGGKSPASSLTLAGGFREWANKKDILIIRGGNRLKFNYNDVVRGKKPDVPLESGDHIVVP